MKIVMPIAATYVADWTLRHAFRELASNGLDAKVELGAAFTCRFRQAQGALKGTVVMTNTGCKLHREALLMGGTSKSGRTDTIGKFGEGLKLGALAAVRAGHAVRIFAGDEIWTPTVEPSKNYKADVLAFTITRSRAPREVVEVELHDVTQAEYQDLSRMFLDLHVPEANSTVTGCVYGDLITDPAFKGRVYVRGAYIETIEGLMFGYDLKETETGRDRAFVSRWDLDFRTRTILSEAVVARPELMPQFERGLETQALDLRGLTGFSVAAAVPLKVRDHVAAEFRRLHGDLAVPCENQAQATLIEHHGRVGVVVNNETRALLATTDVLTALEAMEATKNEVVKTLDLIDDLSSAEFDRLTWGLNQIRHVRPLQMDDLSVVEFRTPGLLGTYVGSKISIAHSVLADKVQTLRVLVHEVAHREGNDGDKSHSLEVEAIWMGLARVWLKEPDLTEFAVAT